LGFGLVIAPLATAVVNGVADGLKATAASLFTVMRMVGMTLGLAGLSAWGTGRFQELAAGIRLTPQGSETLLEAQGRFQEEVTEAGVSLFQEFFLAGMVICLLALLPALFLRRERGEQG
jgi:asparagine N-glycosylation enzyme membrane subunit Stt3